MTALPSRHTGSEGRWGGRLREDGVKRKSETDWDRQEQKKKEEKAQKHNVSRKAGEKNGRIYCYFCQDCWNSRNCRYWSRYSTVAHTQVRLSLQSLCHTPLNSCQIKDGLVSSSFSTLVLSLYSFIYSLIKNIVLGSRYIQENSYMWNMRGKQEGNQ